MQDSDKTVGELIDEKIDEYICSRRNGIETLLFLKNALTEISAASRREAFNEIYDEFCGDDYHNDSPAQAMRIYSEKVNFKLKI